MMVASPGPATLAVATCSMSEGRKPGLRFGIGLSVGHIFWGALAATGVGAILQTASSALMFLKLIGGAYLLWLAFNAARTTIRNAPDKVKSHTEGRWFFRGLVLNLSNPKVVMAWMTTLSLGARQDQSSLQVIVTLLLCITLAFITNIIYALVFSTGNAIAVYARLKGWIQSTAALIFAAFGVVMIRSAFDKAV